jgi:hypothetical protein
MPNQGFNTLAAIRKAGTKLRLTPRKTPDIQTGLLEPKLFASILGSSWGRPTVPVPEGHGDYHYCFLKIQKATYPDSVAMRRISFSLSSITKSLWMTEPSGPVLTKEPVQSASTV